MKICIIASSYYPEINGLSICLEKRLDFILKNGHEVLLLIPAYPDSVKPIKFPEGKITIKPMPSRRHMKRRELRMVLPWFTWRLKKNLSTFKPDIISVEEPERLYGLHIFGMDLLSGYGKAIGVKYARKNNIPIVAGFHTNFAFYSNIIIPKGRPTKYRKTEGKILASIYNPYDSVICSSQFVGTFLKQHNIQKTISGQFIGINDNESDKTEKSSLIPDKDNSIKILYVGRIAPEKNLPVLVSVLKALIKKYNNVTAYIVGGGGGVKYIKKEIESSQGIHFLGEQAPDEVTKIYNSCDIFFSPSFSETLGLTVLEAMDKELPVVVAYGGGYMELLKEGVSGFFGLKEEDFISKLDVLIRSKELRKQIGAKAKKEAASYSWDKCTRRLLNTYGNLCQEKKFQAENPEKTECLA